MDTELKKATTKAGIKLGGGLLVVGALIGFRMVTADPTGIQDEIAELEAVEEELAEDAESRGVAPPSGVQDDSFVARVGATVRENLPLNGGDSGPDPDRLVSCRLGGSTQFMRAGDCLARGGDSTDFESKKK